MILRLFVGAILCVVGFYFVKKPDLPLGLIGPVNFAERAFTGGSRSFYKLAGVLLILLGFLAITNLYGNFIQWLLSFIYH